MSSLHRSQILLDLRAMQAQLGTVKFRSVLFRWLTRIENLPFVILFLLAAISLVSRLWLMRH